MESDAVSPEELLDAKCAECGDRLTADQVEAGADPFMCECGSRDIRLGDGSRIVYAPD